MKKEERIKIIDSLNFEDGIKLRLFDNKFLIIVGIMFSMISFGLISSLILIILLMITKGVAYNLFLSSFIMSTLIWLIGYIFFFIFTIKLYKNRETFLLKHKIK